jgi:hypothetical protein
VAAYGSPFLRHPYHWRLTSAAYGSTLVVALVSSLSGSQLVPVQWSFLQWASGTSR